MRRCETHSSGWDFVPSLTVWGQTPTGLEIVLQDDWASFKRELDRANRVYMHCTEDRQTLYCLIKDTVWAFAGRHLKDKLGALREGLSGQELYATNGKEILHLLGAEGRIWCPSIWSWPCTVWIPNGDGSGGHLRPLWTTPNQPVPQGADLSEHISRSFKG